MIAFLNTGYSPNKIPVITSFATHVRVITVHYGFMIDLFSIPYFHVIILTSLCMISHRYFDQIRKPAYIT